MAEYGLAIIVILMHTLISFDFDAQMGLYFIMSKADSFYHLHHFFKAFYSYFSSFFMFYVILIFTVKMAT